MSSERFGGLRARITLEAARLMIEEDVKQYFTAKRIAARRLLGRVEGRRAACFRPHELPSNGEIREAILYLAELADGPLRRRRLFALRVVALEVMRPLEAFRPRLIGSVSTGHVRRGSDIDLHVFPEQEEDLERAFADLGWAVERELACIQKGGEMREYVHYRFEPSAELSRWIAACDGPRPNREPDPLLVEFTVYEPRELRQTQRSSTDGKPIVRVTPRALDLLLSREHPLPYALYRAAGARVSGSDGIALLERALEREEAHAEIEEDDEEPVFAEPGEEDDPEQLYEPLPGFET
ncbi:MAG: nucleotide-binding enzyme [Polyangiaceae bacterium]